MANHNHSKKADPRVPKKELRRQKSVGLPDSLWTQVETQADAWGVSETKLIEQAIRDYLEKKHG